MFSVTYTQEHNTVNIHGYSPINPENTFSDQIKFQTEKEAEVFCFTIQIIQEAVKSRYRGKFAVSVYNDIIDVTTENTIPKMDEGIIYDRIVQTLQLMPIASRVEFHTLTNK